MAYQPTPQFAEDAAHTSGDSGIQVLAVRNDTRASLSGTNGDYSPLQTNSSGDLRVDASAVTQPVAGTVADAATDSGNPVKVGAKYLATPNTYTDGQRADLQVDARGNLRTILYTGTTALSGNADNADGVASTSTNANLAVRSRTTVYNGTTWDRQYSNWNTTTGDTGAKTASFNGATQTNYSAKGASILFNIGTVSGTTPTLVAKIQGSADSGTTWYDIPSATTTSLTATGTTLLTVCPGVTVAANAAVSYPLPRTWRVVYTIGGTTPSFTITNVQVAYVL